MRRIFAGVFFFLSIFAFLTSCARQTGALGKMRAFSEAYGGGIVYSPAVPEGETGHAGEDFFRDLFGVELRGIEDYAVLFFPSPENGGETGLFLCRSDADAMATEEICLARTELFRKVGALASLPFGKDAFVERYGRWVAYAVLPDAARARRLLRAICS